MLNKIFKKSIIFACFTCLISCVSLNTPTSVDDSIKNAQDEKLVTYNIKDVPKINGYVDFGKIGFKTKATQNDIINNNAIVTLIDPATNQAVAGGITNAIGDYVILANPKVPFDFVLNKIYVIEAHKRFPDAMKGVFIGLRTYVRLKDINGTPSFESITGTIRHAINSHTTAVSIMVIQQQITDAEVFSKINIDTNTKVVTSVLNINDTVLSSNVLNKVAEVEAKLTSGFDPVIALTGSGGTGTGGTGSEGGVGGST